MWQGGRHDHDRTGDGGGDDLALTGEAARLLRAFELYREARLEFHARLGLLALVPAALAVVVLLTPACRILSPVSSNLEHQHRHPHTNSRRPA